MCQNSRDCFDDQICIQGTCRLTCSSNDTCPESLFCANRICLKDVKCISHNDCAEDEQCDIGSNGISKCLKVCENEPCGRNAYCSGISHKSICMCKKGFLGDPVKGCEKKECDDNSDCSDDKFCENNMCKIACSSHKVCGENSICSSEKHKHVCYCQPGFTGDPEKGCTEINWCKSQPCADGAECINTRSNAKCVCPVGTIGNPYEEGCYKAEECRFNRDCPVVARCTVIGTVRKCTGK